MKQFNIKTLVFHYQYLSNKKHKTRKKTKKKKKKNKKNSLENFDLHSKILD